MVAGSFLHQRFAIYPHIHKLWIENDLNKKLEN